MATAVVGNVGFRGVVGAVPGSPRSIYELDVAMEPAEIQKIAQTVGLSHLHRAEAGQTAGDLCVSAAERLLVDLDWDRGTVDGLIMVTQTPDHFSPATACVIHGKLGLPDTCVAFDMGMGCSGYVYGLLVASQMISTGTCRRVLLLAGDTLSPVISPADRSIAVLFGDAGSATALEFDPLAPAVYFAVGTDGSGASCLQVPAGAFRKRPASELMERVPDEAGNVRSEMDLYMDGLAVFNFTLKRVPPVVQECMKLAGWGIDQVDAFAFHQANAFMLSKLAKKIGAPPERFPMNIEKYGNTSMTTIPLLLADTLAEQIRGDKPKRLLLAGFGVGLSWASAAMSVSNVRAATVVQV
jgi:3-oxoacyl-[acyl-carrier-protein] synthase III